jgi:TusA-related sulfurtransferase
MEVLITTKIYDLLKEYPHLEDELIKINPKFKKLKNPVLKRTVARVASIKQAAIVGGMEPQELLNKIRALVGQEAISVDDIANNSKEAPIWIANEPKIIIDANELLDKEQNPLAASNKAIKELQNGEILLIKSDFMPQPLIDEFIDKGYEVYSSKIDDESFLTYILKP